MTARSLLDRTGVFFGLVLVAAIFGMLVGRQFFAPANLELMARQTAIVCMAALGMTVVIATGGIDLSVGSMISLTTVVIALALRASRHMMGVRENSKTPAVLIFDELRRVLEFAGPLLVARGSLADPKDAVYLCYEELKGLLGGAAGPSLAELADRKAQLARCGAVQLPDLVEAEPGHTYLDRETGEPLEIVGKLLPLAPSKSALPWAVENLRFCNWCDQMAQKDLNDCPTCGRRMAALPR